MTRRPKGAQFRNLVVRGGTIYFRSVVNGTEVRRSLNTSDWHDAAAMRNAIEAALREGRPLASEVPTFKDAAKRYLQLGSSHLAGSTREDRVAYLKPEGALVSHFGPYRVDAIERRHLVEWWEQDQKGRGDRMLTDKAKKSRLDALSAVFSHCVERDEIPTNPCDQLRSILRRKARTKKGRAASDPSRDVRPIEKGSELKAFLDASATAGGAEHVLDVLLLDSGIRLGEALGLCWGDVWFGRDANDTSRCLRISRTLARGRHDEAPKSGRERTVALSRRLRALLLDWQMKCGRPEPDQRLLRGIDESNYRNRHFARVCTKAEIGPRRPKDLRDTYASQLLTAGLQLGYISKQLGHADVAVTARHYAKWCGADGYKSPKLIRLGQVPADLLERLTSVPFSKDRAASETRVSRNLGRS